MNSVLQGIYVITDTTIQSDYTHIELARLSARGGASIIQFRDKKRSPHAKLAIIRSIRSACEEYDSKLIVNDRVDLAIAGKADGVHLGQDDLPVDRVRDWSENSLLIGASASTLEEARDAEKRGADYIGFGHIFKTTTKEKEYEPRGVERLSEVAKEISIPVFGIGGITKENASEVLDAGAAGIVVSSAVCKAEDPAEAVHELIEIYKNH